MIAAVVLGAGESRRMGRPKLLLPFGGATIVETIVTQLIRSGVGETLVVLGHEPQALQHLLERYPVRTVIHPHYREGMLSTVRAGLRAASADAEAVLVCLGDQPTLTAETIDALIGAYRDSGRGIAVPVHAGRRGHPLLVSCRYRDEILSRYDDVGLRGLLREHAADILEVPVTTPSILVDLDTPEDYARALGGGTPS